MCYLKDGFCLLLKDVWWLHKEECMEGLNVYTSLDILPLVVSHCVDLTLAVFFVSHKKTTDHGFRLYKSSTLLYSNHHKNSVYSIVFHLCSLIEIKYCCNCLITVWFVNLFVINLIGQV